MHTNCTVCDYLWAVWKRNLKWSATLFMLAALLERWINVEVPQTHSFDTMNASQGHKGKWYYCFITSVPSAGSNARLQQCVPPAYQISYSFTEGEAQLCYKNTFLLPGRVFSLIKNIKLLITASTCDSNVLSAQNDLISFMRDLSLTHLKDYRHRTFHSNEEMTKMKRYFFGK